MNNSVLNSLIKFISADLLKKVIYTVDGKYVFFNQYVIDNQADYYNVHRYRDEKVFIFNKLRNATTWIILDRYNKFFEANRVLELDQKLCSIEIDKKIHLKLTKKTNLETYILYQIKLQDDSMRQKKFQNELDKYITMAKNCQQRGFEHELNRTSRTQKD